MFQLFLILLEVVYLILAFKTGKIVFYIIAFSLAAWWLYERNKDKTSKDEELQSETVEEVERYSHTRYRISTDYLSALMIDENTKKVRILQREDIDSPFEVKEFTFKQLYEIAIVEDGNNIAHTSVGDIIGWSLAKSNETLNGDTEKSNEVKKLVLKIIVDDLASPTIEYIFLDNKHPISKETDEYKDIFKDCNNWYQKLSIIIKRNQQVNDTNNDEIEINKWA